MKNFNESNMKETQVLMWELFEKTGEAGYYMLYKKLTHEDDIL